MNKSIQKCHNENSNCRAYLGFWLFQMLLNFFLRFTWKLSNGNHISNNPWHISSIDKYLSKKKNNLNQNQLKSIWFPFCISFNINRLIIFVWIFRCFYFPMTSIWCVIPILPFSANGWKKGRFFEEGIFFSEKEKSFEF